MVVEEAAETDSFHIEMDGDVYVVAGSAMERLLDSVNFDDDESVNWFHRSLRRLGVIDALRQNGAGEGDTVRIADIEFDFID
jgi:GTP-binding protein